MDCRIQMTGPDKVCPVTSRNQLLTLSFSDIRRISAVRARERLQRLIKLQDKKIPRGTMPVNSAQVNSLLPLISSSQIRIVCTMWARFMKHIDYHGVRLIIRFLEENPDKINLFPKLPGPQKKSKLQYLISNLAATQYGHTLVLHLTDIIANLRNNAALESYIKQKFQLLEKADFKYDSVQACRDQFLRYLAESLASDWSAEASKAWGDLTNALIQLGTERWKIQSAERQTPRESQRLSMLPYLWPTSGSAGSVDSNSIGKEKQVSVPNIQHGGHPAWPYAGPTSN